MFAIKQLSLSVFLVSTLTLVACGGGGGGSSTDGSSTSSKSNPNEIPTLSSTPLINYTTTFEQNLTIINEKNNGISTQLVPSNGSSNSVIEPSYSVRTYGNSGLSFYYKLDKNQFIRVEYDKLSGKVINARIDTEKSSLSCRNDKWTPEGCEGISMIYDDRTGDSTLLFNNKKFEDSYYTDSSSTNEKITYLVTLNGTVKGSISSKPLVFTDFEKTHNGEITVNGKKMDILRAYMRDTQLVVQFTNGESLYLLTGKSSGLVNSYYTGEEILSSAAAMGTLKKLDNDRVNVEFNNVYFNSKTGSNSKIASGNITLINSYAKIDISNVGKIDTNEVYAYELSNKEITYFITSTTGHGYITVQGQNPVNIQINGYSCTLSDCKNVLISKDGSYIQLKGTKLGDVSVTGSIRTNIH